VEPAHGSSLTVYETAYSVGTQRIVGAKLAQFVTWLRIRDQLHLNPARRRPRSALAIKVSYFQVAQVLSDLSHAWTRAVGDWHLK